MEIFFLTFDRSIPEAQLNFPETQSDLILKFSIEKDQWSSQFRGIWRNCSLSDDWWQKKDVYQSTASHQIITSPWWLVRTGCIIYTLELRGPQQSHSYQDSSPDRSVRNPARKLMNHYVPHAFDFFFTCINENTAEGRKRCKCTHTWERLRGVGVLNCLKACWFVAELKIVEYNKCKVINGLLHPF